MRNIALGVSVVMYVVLCLSVCLLAYIKNFVADFLRQTLNFTGKNSKIAFCVHLRVTYTVHYHQPLKKLLQVIKVVNYYGHNHSQTISL